MGRSMCGLIFSTSRGKRFLDRGAPDWAMRVAAGGPRIRRTMDLFFPRRQVQRDSRASSDGKHRYTVVLGLAAGAARFLGPRGVPFRD